MNFTAISNYIARSQAELFPHQLVNYKVTNLKSVNKLSKTVDQMTQRVADISRFLTSLDTMPSSVERNTAKASLTELLQQCEQAVEDSRSKLSQFMDKNFPTELDFYQKEVLAFIKTNLKSGKDYKSISVTKRINADWKTESGNISYQIVTTIIDLRDKQGVIVPYNIMLSAVVDTDGKAIFSLSIYLDREKTGQQFTNTQQLLLLLEQNFEQDVLERLKEMPDKIVPDQILQTSPKIEDVKIENNIIRIQFSEGFSPSDINRILVKVTKLFISHYGTDFDKQFKIRHRLKDGFLEIFLIGHQDTNELFDQLKTIFDIDPVVLRSIVDAYGNHLKFK